MATERTTRRTRADSPRLSPAPRPQLATRVEAAPQGDGWLHEIKFDGYRLMARIAHGQVQLTSRQGHDWSSRFPALLAAFGALRVESALVDGEVIALEPDGVSSFRRLQEALAAGRTGDLVFEAFDLLELDGEDLTETPLELRKALLERVIPKQDGGRAVLRYVGHIEGRGAALLEEVCRLGLEGIVSKRRDARYRSGRNDDWRKTKCIRQAEFVIGGYTESTSTRAGFGSLLLGAYGRNHELRYTGNVGTGFSTRQLRDLHAELTALETRACPFDVVPARTARGVHWVRPELVADVEFAEWTRDGRLRQPVFRGIREDRDPGGVEISAQGGPEPPRTPRLSLATRDPGRTAPAGPPRRPGKGNADVAGVRLTHPDRELYPQQGLTKLDLARYYERVCDSMLPYVARRPLALVRCPRGSDKPCFFQRHPSEGLSEHVGRVDAGAGGDSSVHLYVDSLRGLVELVQLGALELHCWGCRIDQLESPDTLVLDLDPGPGVEWAEVVRAARELGAQLEELGLNSFPKLTGGKGLHLVVPLEPAAGWDEVKALARAIAKRRERDEPERFVATMSKARRHGRIFIDYLRNGRGATAIAPYSSRAKGGAPVAVPIAWRELGTDMTSGRYTVATLPRRLSAMSRDPWEGYESARRPVTRELLADLGAAGKR